jgi:O-antigen/teichoic acid export membrane protein
MNLGHARSLTGVTGAAMLYAGAAALLGVATARFLGPAGQGAFTLVTTVVALVVVSLTLGTGASMRLRSTPIPTEADVRAFHGLSAAITPIAGLLSCAIVLWLNSGVVSGLALLTTTLFGALSFAARQVSDLVQAYGHTSASILSLGVGTFAQTVIFVPLVLLGRASLTSALACGVFGTICQIAFGLGAMRKHRPPIWARYDPSVWRDLMRTGSPTLGYSLGLLAMQRVDRLLLVSIAGPVAGGTYAVAATIAESARITSSAIGQLLFVRTATARRVTHEVRHLYRIAILIQMLAIAVIAVIAPTVVSFMFGPEYAGAVALVRGLLAAEFFMGLALMDSRIIMGMGRFAEIGTITVAAVALSVIVYWLLIRHAGANGAVAGSIVVYGVYAFALLTRRIHHANLKEGAAAHV